MQKPQLGIMHLDGIDKSFFDDFTSDISHSELNLVVEERPEPGPFACAEWFIPTAIVVFVGKAYFQEFLKEMGKDHYQALKNAIAKLSQKTINQRRFEPVLIGTPGKVNQSNPYTMTFSIIAEASDGYNFKLLLPKYSENFDYDEIAEKFMDFIADYHLLGAASKASEVMEKSGIPGGTVLVCLNPETSEIEWQDHVPPEVRARMSV